MANILDLLFPKFCLDCRGEGAWLCDRCFAALADRPPRPIGCPQCGALTDGRFCAVHRPDYALDGLVFVDYFQRGVLREAIHTFKYEGIRELARPLGLLLAKKVAACPQLFDAPVVPLPLHRTRLRERGYNQSHLLACELAINLSRDVVGDGLVRVRHKLAQAKLSREERLLNVEGCYAFRRRAAPLVSGRTIILVDDVYTTGATLNEAAKIIKKAGATQVWGAVLAKER